MADEKANTTTSATCDRAEPEVRPAQPQPEVATTTTQGAPLIQISHLHVASDQSTGFDNGAFLSEGEDEASVYSLSRPVSPASQVSSGTGAAGQQAAAGRRSSHHFGSSPAGAKLHVPDTGKPRHRRQSLGSTLSSAGPDPGADPVFTFEQTGADPWGGFQGPADNMATLGVDHITRVQGPRSPGGRSMRSEWSELAQLERCDSIGSCHSIESFGEMTCVESNAMSGVSSQMSARIKDLVRKFNSRTERFKEEAIRPISASSIDSMDARSVISGVSGADLDPPGRVFRLDSFVPLSRASHVTLKEEVFVGVGRCRFKLPKFLQRLRFADTIDPTRKPYISWLFLLTLAFMYNAVSIPLRAAFYTARYYDPIITYENVTETVCEAMNATTQNATAEVICNNVTSLVARETYRYYIGYETDENRIYWRIVDYLSDFMYLVDIILVKGRLRFINNGLVEKDRKITRKNYITKIDFKLDILSLTPLDLFYLIPAVKFNSFLRLPRLLKLKTFWEFYDRVDRMVSSAYIIRVIRTLTYMLYLIHIEACGYYAMSAHEGLQKNEWVYSGEGIAYIRCMYLATKTATSIGNNPRPTNIGEYLFMTVYWLSGVFVFAMLIGQIRDIFQSAGMAKEQYRKTMDSTLFYMKSLNLPKDLQHRVRTWFNYNWETSKTLDENSLVEPLPTKMKADLAIHVHFNTLSKVHLFQDCDKNLLFDLVLKLKPALYLKGDYICKKGEVGIEMYIVMSGQVEVVGGENNSVVFATLHEGSAFGEISLLALAGGNRRTADVRSKGFSQLFILSKNDFEEAMRDYPAAAKILKKRAKKLLAQNAKHNKNLKKVEVEEVIKSRPGTPKLLKTVIQALDADSHIHDYLGTRSSHGNISYKKDLVPQHDSVDSPTSSSGSLPSRGAIHQMCETQEQEVNFLRNVQGDDDEFAEEEILAVEYTGPDVNEDEIHTGADMCEDEMKELNKDTEIRLAGSPLYDTGSANPTRRVTRSNSSCTINSGIASILGTPTKKANELPILDRLTASNRVAPAPASLVFEDDRLGTPTKKSSLAPVTSLCELTKAQGAVWTGGSDVKEELNRRTAAAAKSGSGPGGVPASHPPRKNKVAPHDGANAIAMNRESATKIYSKGSAEKAAAGKTSRKVLKELEKAELDWLSPDGVGEEEGRLKICRAELYLDQGQRGEDAVKTTELRNTNDVTASNRETKF